MLAPTLSERRQEILHLVARDPGATPADIARALDVDHSTAAYHLRRLGRAGFVEPRPIGRALRYFSPGCRICPFLRETMPVLRDPRYATVVAALEARGGRAFLSDMAPPGEEGRYRARLRRMQQMGLVQRGSSGWELTPETSLCRERAAADGSCGLWGCCAVYQMRAAAGFAG
jgi:Mn-dependent DtxR family transcriptional regulator